MLASTRFAWLVVAVGLLWCADPLISAAQGRGATSGRPGAIEWWAPRPYAQEGYAPRRAVRKDAPPFCRNRQGHPVHGWRWCIEKGFVRPEARHAWRPYRPSQIVVVNRRPRQVVRSRVVFRADVMIDLLGRDLYRNVRGWGKRSGFRGDPVARWVPFGPRGWVLQVSQDGFPLAEMIDRNGDRRIDDVWVYEPERLHRDRYRAPQYDDDRGDERYDDGGR